MRERWLEGYLLTGGRGRFNCYEAFITSPARCSNQHAKWLKVTAQLPWRRNFALLNYRLASHVWQQDHNGFTHQDPGFIGHVASKEAGVVRVYLPPGELPSFGSPTGGQPPVRHDNSFKIPAWERGWTGCSCAVSLR